MSQSNSVLDYIKVLIWPTIFVMAFLIYGKEIFSVLGSREIEVFGLKVGKKVEDISDNYRMELEELRERIKQIDDNKALLDKIEGIESNLNKEMSQVKSSSIDTELSSENIRKRESVVRLEREGFEKILNRDINGAIRAFSEASTLWPEYHNVSEIRNLLLSNKIELSKPNNVTLWKEVSRTIMIKYSWGIPTNLRRKITEFSK